MTVETYEPTADERKHRAALDAKADKTKDKTLTYRQKIIGKAKSIIQDKIPALKSTEALLNAFYNNKAYTKQAANVIKAINTLGHANVPIAKQLTEQLDTLAHGFATEGGNRGAGMGWEGYTGTTREMGNETKDATPNILKIFLGQEENVLPVSDVKPGSWTKGDPEQGWRSIKEFSHMGFKTPPQITKDYDFTSEHTENFRKRELNSHDGLEILKMKEAVDKGYYDVTKHAVKLYYPEGIGIKFNSSVDLGHSTMSMGYDEEKKQYYVSVTDVWDFNPQQYLDVWGSKINEDTPEKYKKMKTERNKKTFTEASFLQASGKAIGIYDRHYIPKKYFDAWFGKGIKKSSTEDRIMDRMKEDE